MYLINIIKSIKIKEMKTWANSLRMKRIKKMFCVTEWGNWETMKFTTFETIFFGNVRYIIVFGKIISIRIAFLQKTLVILFCTTFNFSAIWLIWSEKNFKYVGGFLHGKIIMLCCNFTYYSHYSIYVAFNFK